MQVLQHVRLGTGRNEGAGDPATRLRPVSCARLVGVGLVLILVACGLALIARPAGAASAKITICHRTHSTTNPYRKITVSQSAVQSARHGGHDLPTGSLNPVVYDPNFTYAPNNKYWEDIIPGGDADGLPFNGSNSIAMN